MKALYISLAFCFVALCCIFVEGKKKGDPNKSLINGNGKKIGHWKKLLKKLGYTDKFHPHEIMTAVTKLKILYHFNPSTKDEAIVKFFEQTKKCGVTDLNKKKKKNKRYIVNVAWRKKDFTYTITSYSNDLPQYKQEEIIGRAFSVWRKAVPNLSFTFHHQSSNADIKFAFAKDYHGDSQAFDGAGPILGHAELPEDGSVHFDDDEVFTDRTQSGINLFSVALHEIGHALGLEHSSKENAVMNALYKEYKGYDIQLDSDDIDGIKQLYEINYTPSLNCQDDDRSMCQAYKNYGYCIEEYYDVMEEVCPDSCGLCR